MKRLELPEALRAEIISHSLTGWPEEVCGLLAGRDGAALELHRGRNVSPTPRVAYELDTDTLARQIAFYDAGLELVAIYHSHPAGPEAPSPTDISQATYPDAVYLICSLADWQSPVLRGFVIREGSVEEVAVG